jgi:hypothetical protein
MIRNQVMQQVQQMQQQQGCEGAQGETTSTVVLNADTDFGGAIAGSVIAATSDNNLHTNHGLLGISTSDYYLI